MLDQKNLRVIFTDKADSVFLDILKTYGFQETDEEFNEYISNDKESREMILRNAVEVMAKKMIPEKKLVELLGKHLEIPVESVEKIVREIKNKLLPLLLVYPDEKFNDPVFREEISRKVFGEAPKKEPIFPYVKKVEIANVEENAEKLKAQGKRGSDTYRESIE